MDFKPLSPSLRFNGFNADWVTYKFSELYEFKTTNSYSRDLLNYSTGNVKNIHYGDIHTKYNSVFNIEIETVPFINVDVDLKKIKDEQYLNEGDLVIADASEDYKDIGKTIEVVNLGKQKVLAGLHTFLARKKSDMVFKGFAAQLMQSWTVRHQVMRIAQGTKVLGIATSRLGNVELPLPSVEEQQKIADFLSSVDKKISLLKEKHALLTQYKKGVMQKLFKQEIRFKDDNGNEFTDWQEFRLSDVLNLILNPLKMEDESDYELITVRRRNGGVDSRGIYKGKEVLVKTQFELKENQFVISKRQIVHGACGIVPAELEGAIVSNEYNVFEPVSSLLDVNFFNLFSQTKYMRRAYFINSDGVHIEKLLFKTQSWLKTKVSIPSLEEQKKIVGFVQTLDKRLKAISEQIELTQTFKKGLLQQMFV